LSPSIALFFGGGGRDGSVFNDILLVDASACTGNCPPTPTTWYLTFNL
jgi:hypothetical protein